MYTHISILMGVRAQGALVADPTPPWQLFGPGPCPKNISKKRSPTKQYIADFGSQNGTVLGSDID